jgi:hypothetical protein
LIILFTALSISSGSAVEKPVNTQETEESHSRHSPHEYLRLEPYSLSDSKMQKADAAVPHLVPSEQTEARHPIPLPPELQGKQHVDK